MCFSGIDLSAFIKKCVCGLLCTILLASFIFSLTGCSLTSDKTTNGTLSKDNPTDVSLCEVAHSIFYAPQYVAIENGYFADEGININLFNGFGADNVMTSLISGDADIGFMGSEASIYIYNEGASDYVVNFAQLTQRAGNFLVSREPNQDFSWNDVKGRIILGGRAGGMPEMLLEYILKMHNIAPETDVNIIQNIDFGSTAAAFASGTGDFTAEFEPSATLLEQSDAGYVVSSLGVDSGYVPYTAYCVKKSYLASHETIIQAFTNAIQSGLNYVNTHSSNEIASIIAPQFPETDINTIALIVDRYKEQDTWKTDTIFEEKSFNLLCDILRESNQLDSVIPYKNLVTTSFSEAAAR